MPGFILIEKTDADSLKRTLQQLPGVGEVEIFECDDEGRVDTEHKTAMLVRVTGNADFAQFAMRHQGYAKLREPLW